MRQRFACVGVRENYPHRGRVAAEELGPARDHPDLHVSSFGLGQTGRAEQNKGYAQCRTTGKAHGDRPDGKKMCRAGRRSSSNDVEVPTRCVGGAGKQPADTGHLESAPQGGFAKVRGTYNRLSRPTS